MASAVYPKLVIAASLPVIGCALWLAPKLSAQVVTATLAGTVTDSSGASVPNASVTITETATSLVRTATTTDGAHNVPFLNPGAYQVDVEAPGFKRYTQESVQLDVSTTTRLDVKLTIGNASETVTVSTEAAQLQTDRAEVAKNFAARTVTELPVANRNFQALAGLMAGVSPPVQNFGNAEDPQGTTFSMPMARAIPQTTLLSTASIIQTRLLA